MDELSRVKKYQELRNEVENDPEKELVSPALSSYAERLNKVNPHLSKVQVRQGQSTYEAIHKKRDDAFSQIEDSSSLAPDFNDDFMSDFLSEVKAYNIEKGYRQNEDTSKDILKPIKTAETKVKEDLSVNNETTEKVEQKALDITLEEDQQVIRQLIENDFEDLEFEESTEENIQSTSDIKLVVEETQKLKLQISEYEKGLIDMNNSVLSSNRLINFLIFVLVLVLMIMLGIAIYWVLYNAN